MGTGARGSAARRGTSPAWRWRVPLLAVLGAGGIGAPVGAAAQETGPAAAAVLVPDTVLVGEPVTLGISVRTGAEPTFPPVLALPEDLEQLGPPRVGRTEDGAWRAAYRLSGWRPGSLALPSVSVERRDGPPVRVTPPSLVVESVLPAEEEPSFLRPPRAPDVGRDAPWALLLAALLVVALAAWLLVRRLRSRREGEMPRPVPAARDPLEEARTGVSELKVAVDEGRIGAAAFYDGLEEVLRRYLARVRGRPPELPMRGLPDDPRAGSAATPPEFAALGARALPVRFGALAVGREMLLSDADDVLAWLTSEEAA